MTDLKENIGIEENRERGETAIQLVLDKQKNETMAMYRKGVGWIAFLWGSSGTNSDFSDGFGMARIIAESEAKKKNDPSMISGRELVRSAPEVIAKGRIKRKYGPPGDRRVDIVYNQNVVTLAWDRARRTFYLHDVMAKAESWILEDGMNVDYSALIEADESLFEFAPCIDLDSSYNLVFEAAGDDYRKEVKKAKTIDDLKAIVKGALEYQMPPGKIQDVTYTITAKGRKWYKGNIPGKNFQVQIEVNEASKGFEIGQTYTFKAAVDIKSSKYGMSISVYPIPKRITNKMEAEKAQQEAQLKAIEAQKQRIIAKGDTYSAKDQLKAKDWKWESTYRYWYKDVVIPPQFIGQADDTLESREFIKAEGGNYKGVIITTLDKKTVLFKSNDIKEQEESKKQEAKKNNVNEMNSTDKANYYLNKLEEGLNNRKMWLGDIAYLAREAMSSMKKDGVDDGPYRQKYEKLSQLDEQIKREKEIQELGGYTGPVYTVYSESRSKLDSFSKGQVIRNSKRNIEKGEPPYLYILAGSSEYYSEDGMSFGLSMDRGWSHMGKARAATEDESAGLKAEDQKKEQQKINSQKLREIALKIKDQGEYPGGWNDPEGEKIDVPGNKHNIYGGGEWFVIGDKYIWFVRNNGSDGDNWGSNNVRTGGAGAIGYRVPYDKFLADDIRRYAA